MLSPGGARWLSAAACWTDRGTSRDPTESRNRGRLRRRHDGRLRHHRDLRVDDWLMYAIESPSASGARGFSRGAIYARDGALVASVAQEGLIRKNSRWSRPAGQQV